MPLIIPNIENITNGQNGFDFQAVRDATDDTAFAQAFANTAYVISGMQVVPLATPGYGASVDPGIFSLAGTSIIYSGGSVTVGAPSGSDRQDIISINASGVLTCTAGSVCGTAGWVRSVTTGLPPVKAPIPSNNLLLGAVGIPGGNASVSALTGINFLDKTVVIVYGFPSSPAPTSGAPGQPLTIGGNSADPTLLVTPRGEFFLQDYGIKGDFSDHAAAINTLLPTIAEAQFGNAIPSYQAGIAACLPPGSIVNSIPLVVPTLCQLRGMGWFYYGSSIQIGTNANCDAVQFFKSPDGVQSNAFFCKLSDVFINGNSPNQAPGDWHNWLNITTNPSNGTATHDPNFDPQHVIDHVWGQSATGDGLYQYLRSETSCDHVWSFSNGGSGFIAGADSEFAKCKSQGNQLGGYVFPYSDASIVGCHSYNNGYAPQYVGIFATGAGTAWTVAINHGSDTGTFTISGTTGAWTTAAIAYNASAATVAAACAAVAGTTCTGTGGPLKSGNNYAAVTLTFGTSQAALTIAQSQNFGAGQPVIYNGSIYKALTALSNYTGNPSTDGTNWIAPSRALNTARSLAGNLAPDWGVGYLVWGAQLVTISGCTAITNAAYGGYQKNSIGCNQQLSVGTVNCNPATGAVYPTNPLNLACYCMDNSLGGTITLSCYNNSNAYILRLINGANNTTFIINTDGSEMGLLSPDSAILNNTIIYNGKVVSLFENVNVVAAAGSALTLQYIANDSTLSASLTVTMPPAVRGAFTYGIYRQAASGGPYTVTHTGVKWPGGTAPVMSAGAGAVDRYDYVSDGAHWYGVISGQAFA